MTIRFWVVCVLVVMVMSVGAQPGYWFDSQSDVVRSGSGECLHTDFWRAADAIVGCDGRLAEVVAPAPAVIPPAPEPEPVAPVPAPRAVQLRAEVYFAFDDSSLDMAAQDILAALIADLGVQRRPGSVQLTGHADRIGTEAYNQALGQARAASVQQYLQGHAGGAAALGAVSFDVRSRGELEPLVACPGQRGTALIDCLGVNRRVEILIDAIMP